MGAAEESVARDNADLSMICCDFVVIIIWCQ